MARRWASVGEKGSQHRAGGADGLLLKTLPRQTEKEQLFKDQPPPGLAHVLRRGGEVDARKGLLRGAEPVFFHQRPGQRFQKMPRGPLQRLRHPAAQLVLAQLAGVGIDGQQPARQTLRAEALVAGVDHAEGAAHPLRPAEKDIFLPDLQAEMGLVEKGQQQDARLVCRPGPGHGSASGQTGAYRRLRQHGADAHRRPLLQLRYGAEAPPVLIVPGEIAQQILHGKKAQPVQLRQTPGPHAGQGGKRPREKLLRHTLGR